MTPGYGWSGDSVTLEGFHLDGASVSVDGKPARIDFGDAYRTTFTVPTLTSSTVGPVEVPVVVTTAGGTLTRELRLSPTLVASKNIDYGSAGYVNMSASFDRAAGSARLETTVHNLQSLGALAVDVSTVLLDGNDVVIGFTRPHGVLASGIFWNWPSDSSVSQVDWTDDVGPDPGIGPWTHSAQLVAVRDHPAELLDVLTRAYHLAMTSKELVAALAPLL
jgi:hypothetical protein